jgi:CDGSH-type Zn-finger protein
MEEKQKSRMIAEITVIDSGPLKITGNFILKDIKKNSESLPGEVWLCRCGKSGNKPFCDESHKNK